MIENSKEVGYIEEDVWLGVVWYASSEGLQGGWGGEDKENNSV